MMPQAIVDTGLSVVYEPSAEDPIVDIVLVHGLKGHPRKTWVHHTSPKSGVTTNGVDPSLAKFDSEPVVKARRTESFRNVVKRPLRRITTRRTSKSQSSTAETNIAEVADRTTFWPGDLLPALCPRARILVYGYDTKITKYMSGAPNQNSIFAHSKDLLYALGRERSSKRPLLFVAHSLGGIIVKDMLAHSSSSMKPELNQIVDSTAAVIFLGTPHRGSQDLAALGEWARTLVSAFRMETNAAILDALGLRTSDLARVQEAFSALWQKHDFRVKTFQEGLGLSGVNLGVLGGKVVPDYSSALGDAREQAETMQASHLELCRFSGEDDPNYRKLSSEIKAVYDDLLALDTHHSQRFGLRLEANGFSKSTASQQPAPSVQGHVLSDIDVAILRSLRFPSMSRWRKNIDPPDQQTCTWLFQNEQYRDWIGGRNRDEHHGLLWLKGKPGAGKSVLMKNAFLQMSEDANAETLSAGFFFNAKGDELERSALGLFKSLLWQLLSQKFDLLQHFASLYWNPRTWREDEESVTALADWELQDILRVLLTAKLDCRVCIFVDSLDECTSGDVRSLVYYFRQITDAAYAAGTDLNICISSRYYPTVSIDRCPEIAVDVLNRGDIAHYVTVKLGLDTKDTDHVNRALALRIVEKSAGVFLWVALVVKSVLQKQDDGHNLQSLLREIDTLPDALESLYTQMLSAMDTDSRALTLKLFQWVILATQPLRLREWHHILAFISGTPFPSLIDWRNSDLYTETDEQLEKRLRGISLGLIEVSTGIAEPLSDVPDGLSVCAGAGSFELEYGDSRVVQVIHESVRQFFLHGRGFAIIDPGQRMDHIGEGHLSIMHTCLDYIQIQELDELAEARFRARSDTSVSAKGAVDGAERQPFTEPSQPATRYRKNSSSRPTSPHNITSPYIYSSPNFLSVPRTKRSQDGSLDSVTSLGTVGTIQSFGSAASYCSRHYPKITISPPASSKGSIASRDCLRKKRSPLVLEKLKSWADAAWNRDHFEQKMKFYQLGAAETSYAPYDEASMLHSLAPDGSQVLDDHAALLFYVTLAFFIHAAEAERAGVWPGEAVKRLVSNGLWQRWLALHEGLPSDTNLLYYVAHRHLKTWGLCVVTASVSHPPMSIDAIPAASGTVINPAVREALARQDSRALALIAGVFGRRAITNTDVGGSMVHSLACQRSVKAMQTFLSAISGLDPNELEDDEDLISEQRTANGETALHLAALKSNTAMVSVLLAHGAEITAQDNSGRTALHLVCFNRPGGGPKFEPSSRYELTKLLLDKGADPNAKDHDGNTALHLSCLNLPRDCEDLPRTHDSTTQPRSSLQAALIDLLLSRGAEVDSTNEIGATPLHIACRWGQSWYDRHDSTLVVIKTLLQAGANPNAVSQVNETPLHIAAARCNVDVVTELVNSGASITERDVLGQSPLHHVAWACNDRAAAILLDRLGADVDVQDENGATPLHFACQFFPEQFSLRPASLALIQMLLQRGAKAFTYKNKLNLSAYDIAEDYYLVKLLEEMAVDSEHAPRRRAGGLIMRHMSKFMTGLRGLTPFSA